MTTPNGRELANRDCLRVGIVGAGAMGRGIAQIMVAGGATATLLDSRPGAAKEARAFIEKMLHRAAEKGRMRASEAEAAVARLHTAEEIAQLAGCQVVVEAIVEQLDAKRDLLRELEEVVGGDTILATNTSSLSVTEIAAALRRPNRVAGFHFFNPVPLMRIVEVISGSRTEPWVTEALSALAERVGHFPAAALDTPGFIVNNAGRAYVTEALRLADEQVAPVPVLDRILKAGLGFPMGPFELLDLTGLDVSHPVMEQIHTQFYGEPRFRPSPTTRRRLAAGLLGRKAGEGFYRYDAKGARVTAEATCTASGGDERPLWVSDKYRDAAALLRDALLAAGVAVETGAAPSPQAVCLVTPPSGDVTRSALAEGLDPARTLGVDTIIWRPQTPTLMFCPATSEDSLAAARAAFAKLGTPAVIADSPGFVAPRVAACIVNGAAEIAQLGIAAPADIDRAVQLGLGYPRGPLSLGDALGPRRIVAILEDLMSFTGDPRYRPSLWLKRRALLGLSLLEADRVKKDKQA